MAIATEQVVTQYLADASGHMRGVAQIVSAQKGMTKSVEETAAATAKAGNSATEFLSKWQIGAGSVGAAVNALKTGFNELLKSQRLTAAAGVVDIDALSTASAGLIERMDLLTLAAASQTGAFKLTQAQMNTAAGAIRALTRDGNDQAKVLDKVTEAITKGTGAGLDDFGIIIDSTGSKIGDFNALMAALEVQSGRVKGSALTQSESISQLGVSFANSMSKIKQSIGEIVIAIQPLIEGIASLTSTAAGWISNISEFGGLLGAVFSDGGKAGGAAYKYLHRNDTNFDEYKAGGGKDSALVYGANLGMFEALQEQRKKDEAMFAGTRFGDISLAGQFGARPDTISFAAKKAKRSGGGRSGTTGLLGRTGSAFASSQDGTISDGYDQQAYTEAAQIEANTNAAQAANDAMNEQLDSAMKSLQGFQAEAAFLMSDAAESNNLEALFGPIEDFDTYANAFKMLTGAVGSAMSAWIDGTGNAGEAVQRFIADSLKGVAVELAVNSIKHAAYGFGALAFGNVPSATLHFKSAAMFGAGAIAAGVAANQLGTSAGASAGSAGGGQSRAPSTIGNGSGGSTGAIIVVGDSFSDDSPRMRQRKAAQLVDTATRGGQGARSN